MLLVTWSVKAHDDLTRNENQHPGPRQKLQIEVNAFKDALSMHLGCGTLRNEM